MKNDFNQVIGYAGFNDVNNQKLKYKIDIVKNIIKKSKCNNNFSNILVAGCGDGVEANIIKECFQSNVVGVDISLKDDIQDENGLILLKEDLSNLSFQNNHFDFIYSYHVLEHVPEPEVVLKELNRVLQKEKLLFVGFPNKNRIVGYIGAHNNVTWKEKLIWNIKDYRDRISGKFENNLGAHAGFTEKEFLKISKNIFTSVIPVRNAYMLLKYSNYNKIIKLLILSKLAEIVFPSNYYICIK